ncbi:MAG: sugar phosphate isomerase/epimerase [Planctomycetota bacterium]|nr:sugar phosphate isomerase/epimerase [Planctomycetota bacterium]
MKIGFIAQPKTPITVEDARFAAEHGMPHLELVWDDFTEAHWERRQAEKNMLREFGVGLSAAGFWRRNPIHPDAAERARCHEELKRYLDYCHELECPVLVTGGGTLLGPDVEACARAFSAAFEPILQHAERRGVRIALYGVHGRT